jgi:ribosomal protein S18 acetylase RimI-like enzyme
MDTYTLSTAQTADLNELLALINSAFRGESSRQGWTHEADLIEGGIRADEPMLREIMANPAAILLVAKNEAAVIEGCVSLQQEEGGLYLGMLTVDPRLQGRGLGKLLLQAAEDYARTIGATHIEMTVIADRQALIDWYARHGFFPTGETRPFVQDAKFGRPRYPIHFLVLKKSLVTVDTAEKSVLPA